MQILREKTTTIIRRRMPQKLRMQRPLSLHHLQLLMLFLLTSSCSYISVAFAFTCSPSPRQATKYMITTHNVNIINRRIQQPPSTKLHYSTNNNDDSNEDENNNNPSKTNQQQRVQVAGVSVSPLGFLVILQSIMNDVTTQKKMEVAFPVQLTSSCSD